MTIARRLLVLLALVLASSTARGAGLVELTLLGRVHSDRGLRFEVQVTGESRSMDLSLRVGVETGAADLGQLLERRLQRAGFGVTRSGDTNSAGPTSLFIEDVAEISVRAGGGIEAIVTACEEMPISLRLLPATDDREDRLGWSVMVETRSADGRQRSITEVEVDVEAGESAAAASDRLSRAAMRANLVSARPTPESWTATGSLDGGTSIGLTTRLFSDSDWGVHMVLPPSVGQR